MSAEHPGHGPSEDMDELDRMNHKLRGLINALGLCVRVMESRPPTHEMHEYSKLIEDTSAQIERLVQKLGARDMKP